MNNIDTKEAEIIRIYNETTDIDYMMNYFNCNQRELRIVLKKHQIDRKYNSFSDELINEIIRLHSSGVLHKDIQYQLLISSQGINKTLDRNHIPRHSYSFRNRKNNRNSEYFDEINNQNKAYLLGMLYADGNNHIKKHLITLSLQESDKDVLEFFKSELNYDGEIRRVLLSQKNPNYKNQCVISFCDAHMSDRLDKLGMVNDKSLKLTFPENIDSSLYKHFIRGYLDGDGCISYDEKRSKCGVSICGTLELCSFIYDILSKNNIKSNIYQPKQSRHKNTYILQLCGNKSSYLFLSWIYDGANFKMSRKYEKYVYFCKKYNKKAA